MDYKNKLLQQFVFHYTYMYLPPHPTFSPLIIAFTPSLPLSLPHLPPIRVVLVTDLHDVSFLEGETKGFAWDLLIEVTIVVEVSTNVFLVEVREEEVI